MPAVSNRSKATTRRRAWDRFSEGALALPAFADSSPLCMTISQFRFEQLLDTALEADIAKRHFEEVMANDASSDLAIYASNNAQHAANREAERAWDEFRLQITRRARLHEQAA